MEIIEHASRASPDGQRRVEFHRPSSGFFGFEETTWTLEDMTRFGLDSYEYWAPSHVSCIYESLEAAMYAAIELPWYRDLVAA